jgi:hypothetical protein
MERQKILNPLTGRMVYADGVVAKSIPKMKKSVGVLEGAIKRTLAKKPETKPETKPEPKKLYGWEDLPDDIKDKISGIVKKQKSRKQMNKDLKNIFDIVIAVLRYEDKYDIPIEVEEEKHLKKYNKLTDDELYDLLYKGGIKKEVIDLLNRSKFLKLWSQKWNSTREIQDFLTTAELRSLPDDKGDNLEFKKYYKNKYVYFQLYYQHKSDDFFVLVNPLEIGEKVLKLLKLRLVGYNAKFLMNDRVSNLKYNEYQKIDEDSVVSYIRKKGYVVNDGIVMMPRGYLNVSSYDEIIRQGLYFIEKEKKQS